MADRTEQVAEVERLVSLGAERVDWGRYPPDPDFVVLADPDGNRFCIVDLSHDKEVLGAEPNRPPARRCSARRSGGDVAEVRSPCRLDLAAHLECLRRRGHAVRMDEEQRLALLRRHWQYAATDQDITHEIYHDDAVLEFPQSGERFEGVENFREWRRIYPAALSFEMRRVRGEGDLWVAENSIRYGDGPWQPTVNILEFRGDKVAHETVYITDTWEAPDWRAKWRAEQR